MRELTRIYDLRVEVDKDHASCPCPDKVDDDCVGVFGINFLSLRLDVVRSKSSGTWTASFGRKPLWQSSDKPKLSESYLSLTGLPLIIQHYAGLEGDSADATFQLEPDFSPSDFGTILLFGDVATPEP
jgi:hypothetical protein